MNVEIAVAGGCCAVLAAGHTTVGRFVLPKMTNELLPATRFGPPGVTRNMIRITWHVVTLMLLGFSALLLTLAAGADINTETLVLRWFVGVSVAAIALFAWSSRRRLRDLLRLPVPLVFAVIGAMCWLATT